MRIPHTINPNVYAEYDASEAAASLEHERKRKLKAENPRWDEFHLPALTELCIYVVVENFHRRQILSGLPCNDKNLLLETLPTDLPLPLVVKHLEDGVYWKRKVTDRWKDRANHVEDYGFSWKRMYMEKHVQEVVEATTPEGFDAKEIHKMCALATDFVSKLDVRELQILQPNVVDDDDDDDDEYSIVPEPKDHIDLSPVIMGLKNLTELHIQFGIKNVGSGYKKNWFQFSIQDARNIGKGVSEAPKLRLLRIHHSTLDDDKVIAMLSQMVRNENLEELDFSHCIIGDDGAMAVAKFLKGRRKLRSVNLCNNKIREAGIGALAFVLTQPECSPLDYLDLRLNTFGDGGFKYLASALIREHPKIQTLILSCCDLSRESGILLGETLARNDVLVDLDVSNNRLGDVAGRAVDAAMERNKTLQFLDLRMTGVSNENQLRINKNLHFNRIRARKGEKGTERETRLVRAREDARTLREKPESAKETGRQDPAPVPIPVLQKKTDEDE